MKVKQQAFSIHSQSTKVKVSMLSQTLNHVHLTSFFTQPTNFFLKWCSMMACFLLFSLLMQAGEVRRLNSAIGDLRGDCDSMVKKVTTLTGGKGEFKMRDGAIVGITWHLQCPLEKTVLRTTSLTWAKIQYLILPTVIRAQVNLFAAVCN